MNVLLCSNLIKNIAAFRKIFHLEPLIDDDEDKDEEHFDDRVSAVLPQQTHQEETMAAMPKEHASASGERMPPQEKQAVVDAAAPSVEPKQIFPQNFSYIGNVKQLRHLCARYYKIKNPRNAQDRKLNSINWSTYAFIDTVKFLDRHSLPDEVLAEGAVNICLRNKDVNLAAYFAKEFGLNKTKQPRNVQKAWDKKIEIRQIDSPNYHQLNLKENQIIIK